MYGRTMRRTAGMDKLVSKSEKKRKRKMKIEKSINKMISVVGRAVGLAMSVAVLVLHTLKTATPDTLIILLGIGMFALALSLMQD
jgi:hypothetical protein